MYLLCVVIFSSLSLSLFLSSGSSYRLPSFLFRGSSCFLGFRALELRVQGFGFWVLGFGFRVLGFGFRDLGFGFWVLGLGGFGFWVLMGFGLIWVLVLDLIGFWFFGSFWFWTYLGLGCE